MIPEDLEKLACAIADKVARRLEGSGMVTSGPEELECFTCTHFKFKCKPAFSITAATPQSGDTTTGAETTTAVGTTAAGGRPVC